ncbi:large conductance mechanosensitive channel protein MscL [Iamia majanohamensis]|uniref:Large-conductance mechanosensitive channel n=1 Tax=Iamia majanohamensis TaxID=467976 RepID=A0AAF0BSM2_9ACTN|nr:large conductance mechanosensitive channel protein MscL [Iamia majanohamensis]WCO68541.1 large conductance mechanosensitive channel protein MscL [Iamia majanohamensis]
MLKEFKDFLMKGNLLEIAVGLILALAFKAVVDSLVADILTPIVAAVFGQPDFSSLVLDIGDGKITYGVFLNAVISFVIIGFVLFLVVKAYNQMVGMARRKGETEETEEDSAEVILLREIRDQLASRP